MHDRILRPMDKHTILQRFYQQAKNKVELAKLIAYYAHEGQMRKVEGEPSIVHPERIAAQIENDEDKCIAWLHDVVEDSSITLKDLQPFFSDNIISGIDALTKVEGDQPATLEKIRQAPKNVQRIKLFDVVDYWKHSTGMPETSIRKNARAAKEVYIPLAKKLEEKEILQLLYQSIS